MITVSFRVPGTPVPQGSKTARIVGKRIRINGRVAVIEPKAVMVELGDMKTKTRPRGRLTQWRLDVAQAAAVAMGPREPFDFPVRLSACFMFRRPPSHLTSKGAVRSGARAQPPLDLSKLVRAVEDAMTGIVYLDDSQVTDYGETSKSYGPDDGVLITVSRAYLQ